MRLIDSEQVIVGTENEVYMVQAETFFSDEIQNKTFQRPSLWKIEGSGEVIKDNVFNIPVSHISKIVNSVLMSCDSFEF